MSKAGYIKEKHYQFLLQYFPGNIMSMRLKALLVDTSSVIKIFGLKDKLRIDIESFENIILDYFTDIARLKDFQDIARTNTDKIYGYELFWFLRRHPIQLLEEDPNLYDINEKIALNVFLPRILADAGLPYDSKKQSKEFQEKLETFIDLLFYNMKYRTYTQQSLELMIKAFLCGCECTRTTFKK